MAKYLDSNGLLYFWNKVKTLMNSKVDKDGAKVLSTNDYTSAEKEKLAGVAYNANAYVLPNATADTLGGIKVGTNLSVNNGVLSAVDTTYDVATHGVSGLMSANDKKKLDEFSAASTYALKSDIAAAINYKGSVPLYTALPTNPNVGDMYNVTANEKNYVWSGTDWDDLGGTVVVDAITNAEIDTIMG